MDSKKTSKEQKLEKDLKNLVSRMKNENAALNKILNQLRSTGDEMTEDRFRERYPAEINKESNLK